MKSIYGASIYSSDVYAAGVHTGLGTDTISINIVFDQDVTGLTLEDFIVTGGTPLELAGSGASYTLVVDPIEPNTVTVRLPAAACVGAVGSLDNVESNTTSSVYSP